MTDTFIPNIIRESDLPALLDAGGIIVVTCIAEPTQQTSGWRGRWTIKVVQPEGADLLLVTTRATHTARVIKTLSGIAS